MALISADQLTAAMGGLTRKGLLGQRINNNNSARRGSAWRKSAPMRPVACPYHTATADRRAQGFASWCDVTLYEWTQLIMIDLVHTTRRNRHDVGTERIPGTRCRRRYATRQC